MKAVSVLGSTGSIGRNVLDVVDRLKDKYRVVALAAGRNIELLKKQIEKFRPELVSVINKNDAEIIRPLAKKFKLKVFYGDDGLEEVASAEGMDIVFSAITGLAGFRPTLVAVKKGCRLAMANKESMVVGGAFIRREASRAGAEIIPVDSEHSGVFQCIAGLKTRHIRRVILTASGGPFLSVPIKELKNKTKEEVLCHPRWVMGEKITVDSATLMNKGLELIEARWLFDLSWEKLDVVIHPQSVVHALVELDDGAYLAQASAADMKIPIQYALTYPERLDTNLPKLDLTELKRLEFLPVNVKRYPLFSLARQALEAGKSAPVALNAANEVAVASFLSGNISFTQIADVVRAVFDSHNPRQLASIDDIYNIDSEIRRLTLALIHKKG